MTEPMSDARLAEIHAEIEDDSYGHSYDGGRAARELLAEVHRLRAMAAPAGIATRPIEATPEQVAEWRAAWDEMLCGPLYIAARPEPLPKCRCSLRYEPRTRDYPVGG